jgi:hypothetical protein
MPQAVQSVTGHISLKCDPDWDPCQKQQACSKVKHMDALAKGATPPGLARLSKLDPPTYDKQRMKGDYWAKKLKKQALRGEDVANEYSHDCLRLPPNNTRPVSGDHSHDISYGGDPTGPLRWMESSVNQSMGSKIGLTQPDVTHATGFSMDCC